MRPRLLTVTASLVVALTVSGVGMAQAAWMMSGSGTGSSSADSLVTPALTATRSTTSPASAIDLSWTAAGQLPTATYEVTRDGTPISCSSSPCTDSGLSAGTAYTYVVTAKLGLWSKTSDAANASTQAASAPATNYLLVATPASITAGTSTSVVITAKRADSTTDTTYNGSKTLTWSGAAFATSPGGTAASAASSVTFTNGVSAAIPVTLTNAGSGLTLTVTTTPGSPSLVGSTNVTVAAAAPTRLAMTSTTTTGPNGAIVARSCVFGCTIEGLGESRSITTKISVTDTYGNIVTLASAISVTLSGSNGTPSPTSLEIPASGPATSTGAVTLSPTNANANNTALTATSQSPATYTSVTAAIKK